MKNSLILCLLCLPACFALETKATPNAPVPHTPTTKEKLAGFWLVDQPAHALYEATLYHFKSDGSLQQGKSTGIYQTPVGQVAFCNKASSSTCDLRANRCTFGSKWSIPKENILQIKVQCTDKKSRSIQFQLYEKNKKLHIGGLIPTKVNKTTLHWVHPDYTWRFYQCNNATTLKQCMNESFKG